MNKRKAFFTGFSLTLSVLLPLYAGVFLWQITRPAQTDAPGYQVPIASPTEEDSKTFLIISQNGQSLHFVLVRADALENLLCVSALPEETVVLAGGKARTLKEALAYAGPAFAADALRETLSIQIDHYVFAKASVLAEIAEPVGQAQVELPEEVSAKSEEGYEIYHRAAGKAVLSPKEGCNLLYYGAFTPAQRLSLVNSLYSSLLSGGLSQLSSVLPDGYRKYSSSLTSNLSAADLYTYESIFGFLGRLSPTVTTSVMPGNWQNGRYELNDDSLAFAAASFS